MVLSNMAFECKQKASSNFVLVKRKPWHYVMIFIKKISYFSSTAGPFPVKGKQKQYTPAKNGLLTIEEKVTQGSLLL